MSDVKPIPAGREMPIAYLMTRSAADAIDFYVGALGGTELYRLPMPDGKIGHAEVQLGGGVIYLADAEDGMDDHMGNPQEVGKTTVSISLYVEDADAVYEKAVAAGATGVREPEDQFYGDRRASFVDPFGHYWSVATHIRDVSPEEMQEAMAGAES